MHFIVPRGLRALCGSFLLTALPACAQTDTTTVHQTDWIGPGHWRVAFSPFSLHFRYNPEHRYVWALGVERQRSDDWLAGISYFRNSFGQPSSYTYVGKRFPGLLDRPELFAQASAGILYGYRGQWKNKVPLNYNGFSPGALVSLGWQFSKAHAVTAHLLGDAGLMVQLSWDLY
jgi:hypothetical protein